MVKGILFVLLALGSIANARDTSIQDKKKIILIVSVLDDVAFTQADTDSLKRYIHKVLPDHELVHVSAETSVMWGPRPTPREVERIRESIQEQIAEKVLTNYEITHFILMDHGNTNQMGIEEETRFKFLGSFSASEVDSNFQKIFNPLVGKFSQDAFVMLESCSTMCSSVGLSQQRVKTLMGYFNIGNGTLFGAYQGMLSQGYEAGFHLGQITNRMKSAVFISASIAVGIASQIPNIMSGHFNMEQFLMFALGTHIVAPTLFKLINYIQEKSKTVNWGYLYKLNDNKIDKIFSLNPYENQNELYLKLEPKAVKSVLNSCNSLFH